MTNSGIDNPSQNFKARAAGALYFFSVLIGGLGERYLHGKLGFAVGLITIAGMVTMTLLFYGIFKPVSRRIAFLAVFLNLVGVAFEVPRWKPQGVNIAIVLLGFFCVLIGYLVLRSTFLPRILGAFMAIAGLGWMTYLSPALTRYLFPSNLAAGLLGEASLCLWLLVMGVNTERWTELINSVEK